MDFASLALQVAPVSYYHLGLSTCRLLNYVTSLAVSLHNPKLRNGDSIIISRLQFYPQRHTYLLSFEYINMSSAYLRHLSRRFVIQPLATNGNSIVISRLQFHRQRYTDLLSF